MIEVFIGPANSGKTEALLGRVVDVVTASQRGAHLIVPSVLAAGVLREVLSEKLSLLPLQSRHPVATTFPALYRTILDKSNSALHWMNVIQRDHVLRFVIAELAQAGKLR